MEVGGLCVSGGLGDGQAEGGTVPWLALDLDTAVVELGEGAGEGEA